ncbi:probable phosphoserine aminotransferase isoform X2 [Bicyclus anynana]|uniref:phosphoserine transaminase n=1 Tax=Bicyclus anynana TaxID=110368 RepID=A0ABM3LP34_BICAN|nr:probable phosphoserine aminotransferase isoform X2 [Bicyclus anynana]
MSNIHNFGAGPAKLPSEVFDELEEELVNFNGTGISLMETSHRSATYIKLNAEIQDVVRRLLNVPQNYKILFLQGGGQGQFAGVPLNLMSRTGTADYVITGIWSVIAAREARKYGNVRFATPQQDSYVNIPDLSTWDLDPNASYVHICDNETIDGVEYDFIPNTNGVPLVADMCSNIMSKKFDITKFGAVYGCAQKNIGTAGVTMVIVREDLLNQAMPACPSVFDWTLTAKNNSILNTPPMQAIEVMGRVLKWIERNGKLEKMEELAVKKSSMIYDYIDQSNGFYYAPVEKRFRSKMNIPFRVGPPKGDVDLENQFIEDAEKQGLIQLRGHRWNTSLRLQFGHC